jgi:hypothetical protein
VCNRQAAALTTAGNSEPSKADSRLTRAARDDFSPMTCSMTGDNIPRRQNMAIEWREEMSVGSNIIDEDHRNLIDLVNSFERSMETFREQGQPSNCLEKA